MGNILGSAWDNLMGGLDYTGQLVTGQIGGNGSTVNISYAQWMNTTLKMWQSAPSELLTALEKTLSSGKITTGQYNAIINRRNQLYKNAGLSTPKGSVKPLPNSPTISEGLVQAGKDIVTGVGNVGSSVAGALGSGTTTVVSSAMGIPVNYIVVGVTALLVVKFLK